jgi:hypothetical protein
LAASPGGAHWGGVAHWPLPATARPALARLGGGGGCREVARKERRDLTLG